MTFICVCVDIFDILICLGGYFSILPGQYNGKNKNKKELWVGLGLGLRLGMYL